MRRNQRNLICGLAAFSVCSIVFACEYTVDPDSLPVSDMELPQDYAAPYTLLYEAENILSVFGNDIWPAFSFPEDAGVYFYFPNNTVLAVGDIIKNTGQFTRLSSYSFNDWSVFWKGDSSVGTDLIKKMYLISGDGYEYGDDLVMELTFESAPTLDSYLQQYPDAPDGWIEYVTEGYERDFCIENSLGLLVHELFHLHQEDVWIDRHFSTQESIRKDDFIVFDENETVLNRYERLSLVGAVLAEDDGELREHVKAYLTARSHKHKTLLPRERKAEHYLQKLEGIAEYTMFQAWRLISSIDYDTHVDFSQIPYFRNYAYAADIYKQMYMDATWALVNEPLYHVYDWKIYYELGAFQCLILDRLNPSWKSSFDWDSEYLDQILELEVPLSEGEMAETLLTLPVRYPVGIEETYIELMEE